MPYSNYENYTNYANYSNNSNHRNFASWKYPVSTTWPSEIISDSSSSTIAGFNLQPANNMPVYGDPQYYYITRLKINSPLTTTLKASILSALRNNADKISANLIPIDHTIGSVGFEGRSVTVSDYNQLFNKINVKANAVNATTNVSPPTTGNNIQPSVVEETINRIEILKHYSNYSNYSQSGYGQYSNVYSNVKGTYENLYSDAKYAQYGNGPTFYCAYTNYTAGYSVYNKYTQYGGNNIPGTVAYSNYSNAYGNYAKTV